MIFGKMKKRNHNKTKALMLLFLFLTTPVYALELTELLQLFSQKKQSSADFNEKKHVSFLDEPIISSGYLKFTSPDKLEKHIIKPEKISHKINANKLEVINSDENHVISLDEHPEFTIILRATISLLAGDYAALKKDFKLNYKNTASNWALLLTPHDSYILGYVESIKMEGDNNKISKIIITEPNHDQSITYLSNHH